ncbi:MAG: tryptophan-rich sensory protein [Bacteroidales bacterium]|nr:tryptophan-rich sensory protein [Bacteroidales bacterium]MCF8455793.1 tryptophan-rich sensory protein [Bacteroidales bacterium]
MLLRTIIFLVINFAALGIGGLFTGAGVPSEWYQTLNKAPWTPPGWVFGAAWTLIMICFSFYMAQGWDKTSNRSLFISLFVIQWILNVAWNPIFFKFHAVLFGLIVISLLTILVAWFLFEYAKQFKAWSFFILPYFIWLLIATSLNGYILLKNP